MLHEIDLRRLSEMHGHERAYVSAYLNRKDGRGTLEHRAQRIRSMLAGEQDELTHFDENLQLVHGWLAENDCDAGPCCIFACWVEGWVEGYKPGVELPDVLRVGSSPYIRPLAELQQEYSRFVVVVADNRATRIFTVTSAKAELEKRIRGDEACGSASVFEVDYVDSLSRHLELTSAELDFVDPIPGLTNVGDVGALLRY